MEKRDLGVLDELRYEPEDEEYLPPNAGGCWICHGEITAQPGGMGFDMEFDTHYHHYCLGYARVDSILAFERGEWREE